MARVRYSSSVLEIRTYCDGIPASGFRFINQQGGPFSGYGIEIYSTFLTSAWVWLYLIAGTLIRMIALTSGGLRAFQYCFNIEKHPLRALGVVSMLPVGLLAGILLA